jgi:hypothetical protein
MSNRTNIAGKLRHFCGNLKCKTKLATPIDNHHKAFCTPYCHRQFYRRRCLVCEKPLSEGHRRQLCDGRQCRNDYRNFRPSYVLEVPSEPNCRGDSKSPCGTGTLFGLKAPPGARIIAGPPLSQFSLWAATLNPPKPVPIGKPAWHQQHPPGHIAAEWTAREWARREAEDAQYVAEDERRIQKLLRSGDNWPPFDGGA